ACDLLVRRSLGQRAFVGLAAITALTGCALAARNQAAHWQTTERLFAHALAVTENNYVANTFLGAALAEQGKSEEALGYCAAALRIKPDYGPAYYEIGNVKLAQ